MRLIDADALKKDDELTEWITRDTIRTGKMLKAFSELFVKKIDDAPTVNAVSEEVYTREYNLRKDAEFKAYKLEKALEQEPKTGRWEWVQYDANPEIGNFYCSECQYIPASSNMNYCPNCGARMESAEC